MIYVIFHAIGEEADILAINEEIALFTNSAKYAKKPRIAHETSTVLCELFQRYVHLCIFLGRL